MPLYPGNFVSLAEDLERHHQTELGSLCLGSLGPIDSDTRVMQRSELKISFPIKMNRHAAESTFFLTDK